MSVLDELREKALTPCECRYSDDDDLFVPLSAFAAFEAAHPGLVDHTTLCRDCHSPTMDSGDGFTVCPACAKESK